MNFLARNVNGRQLYPKVTTKDKLISFRQRLKKKEEILSFSYSKNVLYTTYKDHICFFQVFFETFTYTLNVPTSVKLQSANRCGPFLVDLELYDQH